MSPGPRIKSRNEQLKTKMSRHEDKDMVEIERRFFGLRWKLCGKSCELRHRPCQAQFDGAAPIRIIDLVMPHRANNNVGMAKQDLVCN